MSDHAMVISEKRRNRGPEEAPPYKYDYPVRSVEKAEWILEEACRRYGEMYGGAAKVVIDECHMR
jgi:hypothetical protein